MPDDKLHTGLIASVKIAQKDLGLEDTTYRPLHAKITALCASLERPLSYADAIIRRQTRNTASLRTASRAQLTACVAALVRQQGREDA